MLLYFIFAVVILLSIKSQGKLFLAAFAIAITVQLLLGINSYLSQDFSYYALFEAIFYPIVLFVVVVITYKRFLSFKKENEYLKESFAELEKEGEELFKNYQNEKDIRINLEKRILKDDSFALKLQQHISSLSSLNPQEIKAKLLEIVCEFINAKGASYYSFKNETFYFEKSYGEESFVLPNIDKNDAIYSIILASKDVISVKDELNGISKDIIISGILRDGKKKPLGLIAINKIDFLDLNYTTVQLFSMLCNWASIALEKAEAYELALQESIKFSDTHILNMDYFLEVFNREVKLARRYKSYFCVLAVVFNDISLEDNSYLVNNINDNLKIALRDIDSIFIDHKSLNRFFVTLQMTDFSGANIVKDKIIARFSEAKLDLDFTVTPFFVDSTVSNDSITQFLRAYASNE
ncbi:MAG: hypothetical protein RL154_1171 [Pseudomonadota bacterium]